MYLPMASCTTLRKASTRRATNSPSVMGPYAIISAAQRTSTKQHKSPSRHLVAPLLNRGSPAGGGATAAIDHTILDPCVGHGIAIPLRTLLPWSARLKKAMLRFS